MAIFWLSFLFGSRIKRVFSCFSWIFGLLFTCRVPATLMLLIYTSFLAWFPTLHIIRHLATEPGNALLALFLPVTALFVAETVSVFSFWIAFFDWRVWRCLWRARGRNGVFWGDFFLGCRLLRAPHIDIVISFDSQLLFNRWSRWFGASVVCRSLLLWFGDRSHFTFQGFLLLRKGALRFELFSQLLLLHFALRNKSL